MSPCAAVQSTASNSKLADKPPRPGTCASSNLAPSSFRVAGHDRQAQPDAAAHALLGGLSLDPALA